MSTTFWKKLNYIAGLFSIAAVFSLLAFTTTIEIKDLDLWLHIGMGRYIVEHGFKVPSVDILSCTIAGRPWVNHEWLFQVIVYFIHQLWGPDGLITMQVVLVTVTMTILLFLGYNKHHQLGSAFMLLLVLLIYQGRFTIRPDLYSLLFFALYILILSFHIDKKWSVFALFIIQILWSNMHGFFFFGPLFVLIGIVAECLKRQVPLPYEWNSVGRLTDDEYRRMKWILVFVTLACLFNPLTFRGAWYPISVFFQMSGESKIFFSKIIELKRPITWDSLFSLDYAFYKLIIVLSLVTFYFNRRKIDIGVFIFWLVFLLFSLVAIRNLIFFAFAAYLAYATNMLGLSFTKILPFKVKNRNIIYLTSILSHVFLITWILQYGLELSLNGYFDFDKYERKNEYGGGISLRSFPYKAVDFLVKNNIQGNFFNDFNSGAYLVGRCFPNIKVFMDGRTEVYGPEFFKMYQQIWEKDNADVFAKALEKNKITGALMDSVHQPVPGKILNYLYKNKHWVPVYFDYDGMIFLKKVPQNKDIIDRFRIDLPHWQAKGLDLFRIGSQKVTPYPSINRAFTLESLDLDDAALEEIHYALKVSPNYLEPYKLMGRIYAKKKDYQKAFENFRIAVTYAPDDEHLRMNLALAYYDMGEYKYAAEQYQKIIDRWPSQAAAHFFLAKTYIKEKLYQKALQSIRNGLHLDPHHQEDVVKLGDLMLEDKEYKTAEEVYQLVLNAPKPPAQAHYKLGLVYEALGDTRKAKEEFEKGKEWKANEGKNVEAQSNAVLPQPETPIASTKSEIDRTTEEFGNEENINRKEGN